MTHDDRHARCLAADLERGFEVLDVTGGDEDGRGGAVDPRLAPHPGTAKVAADDPGPERFGTFDPIRDRVAIGHDRNGAAGSAQRLHDEEPEAAEPADDNWSPGFRGRIIHIVGPHEIEATINNAHCRFPSRNGCRQGESGVVSGATRPQAERAETKPRGAFTAVAPTPAQDLADGIAACRHVIAITAAAGLSRKIISMTRRAGEHRPPNDSSTVISSDCGG